MAFGSYIGIALVLAVWTTVQTEDLPNGVHMECRDRYLMVLVDLSFTGEQPRFEAIDETGVYAITKEYAAQCGYSVSPSPLAGYEEHRASYFSCHTQNKDDNVFTFNFNLIATHEGNEVTYALNKTCSPSLPWSPREVTCEVNYMEVSVRSDVTCPSGTKKHDWNALKPAHGSTTSDWQVMFQRNGEALPPMSLSKARKQGYVFDLTDGRLVFRAPYGQPESFSTEVNGVPVEMVHATLFSRQSWVVLMVDLMAACSMHGGLYDDDDGGFMMWATPENLYPSLDGPKLNVGLKGELVEQPVAEQRGYVVEKRNATVQISIPYNAEGGYRKSFVTDGLYKFYIFHLYLEQILVDADHAETRLRYQRLLTTPLLPCPIFTENQTVLDEQAFTVYLGDIPEDVQLVAVHLNGHEFTVPFTNTSSYSITEVLHPNNTHGYTLKVPFDDPVVTQELSKKVAVIHYGLHINFTLLVLPENAPYHHLVCIVAVADVAPPVFDAICSKSGISFKLDHRPFDYMWEISIGSDPLTSKLAAQLGYIMSNNSQSLMLEVPLFSHGYKYKDVTLKGFSGTFEILMRDPETSEVQSSTIKTCQFSTSEFIMCSTDGKMTFVVDLALVAPSGGSPARSNLVDKSCKPKETAGTRALFSVPLIGCGSTVKLNRETVTYQNEIFYSHKNLHKVSSDDADVDRVIVQCTYPVAALHRLFAVYKFVSDTAGVGKISHSTAALQIPTIKPAKSAKRPVSYKPASRPPVPFKVLKYRGLLGSRMKGPIPAKANAA